jgi:hypothetical protein
VLEDSKGASNKNRFLYGLSMHTVEELLSPKYGATKKKTSSLDACNAISDQNRCSLQEGLLGN